MQFRFMYDSEIAPVEGATQQTVPNWDTRICSETEWNRRFESRYGNWRSHGTNHEALPNGQIRRQCGTCKIWVIELNSMEELRNLMLKHPDLALEVHQGEFTLVSH